MHKKSRSEAERGKGMQMTDQTPDDLAAINGTSLALLVLIVVVCSIPFLSQPFHMDDNLYLDVARNTLQKPFFPQDMPYTFIGEFGQDLGSNSHPLMQSYFLATVLYFFGEGPGKEWIYHLFALIYPILAVLSFYFIAARFNERPLWPSMILACCPLFMVMQHSLMTDIPMLAFWLAAIASFLWAVQLNSRRLFALSVVFQFAAMFTSYQSFALTPLLGFYLLRKGRNRKALLSLLIAPALLMAWFTVNCFYFKRLLWGVTFAYVQSRSPFSLSMLWMKLLAILEYQGWLIIFPIFIFYILARYLKGRALVLGLLVATCIAQLRVPEYRFIDKAIFVLGLAAGFFVALEMAKAAWSALGKGVNRLGIETVDGQFIGLWYFGVFFYCLFLLPDGSARYLLPLVPPFLLCFFRILERSETSEYRLPPRTLNAAMVASGSLVVSLAWGLLLSRADQEFARIYPRAANDIVRAVNGAKAYGVGEWGFRYYLEKQGIASLPIDESRVRGGSYLAVPRMALPHGLPADLDTMLIPVGALAYRPDFPLRIFDWQTPAGFYSSSWGLIPFTFSRRNLEEIKILQVSFMVDQLPLAQIETDSGINPWPSSVTIQDKSALAIAAMPGTKMVYQWPLQSQTKLKLLCGVASDSIVPGSEASYYFEIRQMEKSGKVLAESGIALQPGLKNEDRNWRPVVLILKPAPEGALMFRYYSSSKESVDTGAFGQAVLEPVF